MFGGLICAVALVRLLPSFSHLLYGVGAWDPLTLCGGSAVLLTAALAACYVPARRAMRTDPWTACEASRCAGRR